MAPAGEGETLNPAPPHPRGVARVYIAGPLFAPQERAVLEAVDDVVRALGHETFLPHREMPVAPPASDAAAKEGYAFLLRGLESCDAVIAILDGPDVDAGTCVELGYATALRRPILGLRSDARAGNERQGINLMAFGASDEVVRIDAWNRKALEPPLQSFLANVRVFAGTLVRDAVPKLLEQEGRALQFRNVAPEEYPAVLKRKLAETVRRLEVAEFGVEQEEIADVLELLETLINLRNYDRESLRSIKEGKWRKRGGFERGFLLTEEPKLTQPPSP
jgi:nucleoside 2-deoxyribosyltransferase